MKVYLSGPITTDPEHYKEHFRSAFSSLSEMGFEVTNPSEDEYDEDLKEKGYTDKWTKDAWREYIHKDIDMVCEHDVICLLQGWEKSSGAAVELATAKRYGLKVMLEKSDGKFTEPSDNFNLICKVELI